MVRQVDVQRVWLWEQVVSVYDCREREVDKDGSVVETAKLLTGSVSLCFLCRRRTARSIPMMMGSCAALATLIGTFDAAGKSISGGICTCAANLRSKGHATWSSD